MLKEGQRVQTKIKISDVPSGTMGTVVKVEENLIEREIGSNLYIIEWDNGNVSLACRGPVNGLTESELRYLKILEAKKKEDIQIPIRKEFIPDKS